jgi:RimJ/RimL family protein N-acetyltransferase
MLRLEPIRLWHQRKILEWRRQSPEAWRTPPPYTMWKQIKWHFLTVRRNPYTYWAIYDDDLFIGQGEISNVNWGNRNGEIGLVIDPKWRGRGYGGESAVKMLGAAFALGLLCIYGEVYHCNSARSFWEHLFKELGGYLTILPNRKYWQGQYYDSTYFSVDAEQWKKVNE